MNAMMENIMNNYLIIGDDSKLIDFHLHDILSKISYDEESKITYDLNTTSFDNILDEASMISLFSTKKLIIGTNFDLAKLTSDDNNINIKESEKYSFSFCIYQKVF